MPFAMRRIQVAWAQGQECIMAGECGEGLRRTICITGVVVRHRMRTIAAAGMMMCGMMPTATLIIMAQP